MSVETVTYISDLDYTQPLAGDPRKQGDDHLRNIKLALRQTFPNISGPVTVTQGQLNSLGNVFYNVTTYGALCDGTTDDTAAWTTAVAAAVAAGGGIVTAPAGKTTVFSSAVTISSSNVRFYLPDLTIKITGSTDYAALTFTGSTLTSPTLGSNAAIYATSVSLSAIGGVAAGGWLMFNKTTPSGSGAYRFISKVRSVSGSGPYTVVLATALPIAFATADAGLELRCISPLENVGVTGNVKFDGSAATGTTVHGIKALYCVNSRFSGIRGVDCDAGAVLWAPYGHGNIFDDCAGTGCGSSSFGGLEFDGQTASQITNHRVLNGTAFGVHITSGNYCTIANLIGEAPVTGRGVKFQSCLENSVVNLQGHGATAANGVAVSVGSCRNTFHGINSNGNATLEGLWLSDQDNCDNYFYGVVANGNGSRDIHIGATDLRNMFFGVKATNVYIGASNATCLFYGLNGALLSGGYASNAPFTLLSKTSGTNSLLLPLATGSGTEGWIGQNAGGTATFVNGNSRVDMYVNNSPIAQFSSTAVNMPTGIVLAVNSTQVVTARQTGYSAMTGTPNSGTVYDVSTVTLPQLAARVAALQTALTTHGLIGS